MRKLFTLVLAVAGLAAVGLMGCTDAGDPVLPKGSTTTVIIIVNDMVGGWDNLHVNGALTGDAPVAMTQDGLSWRGSVAVSADGTYGYGIYTDDGTKALVPVLTGLEVAVAGGMVTGDTEPDIMPGAGTGFRMVVYNGNPAYENIKIKGSMNEWAADRSGMSADGTVFFLDIPAGLEAASYEWGVIEDDGTEFGIWLLPPGSPNLTFAVDAEGVVTGTTTFEIASPAPETTLTLNCDMNAFEGNFTTVHVRGTFNGWAQTPTDLTDPDEDGVWSVTLDVEQDADVIFKFITDGSNYESVPAACGADDGYGGYNRSVSVGTEPVTFTAPWADCPAGK
jgi:hypothetical protein